MTKTNLITGFLGSGKTTTILQLLKFKPDHEQWAVLVNEFGEVGIDGALLADSGALLKEIPGGCMCCVNGLPMQVGLNTLLRHHQPDRLLIEPTGLGHPGQIVTLLQSEVYRPWITLHATWCLLDARSLLDERIAGNVNFQDQLAVADVIVANKADRQDAASRTALNDWYQAHGRQRVVEHATQGRVSATLLDLPHRNTVSPASPSGHQHRPASQPGLAALSLPNHQRWRRSLNQGQGYFACGWIFDAETVFDTVGFLEWARLAPVDRLKGVMRIPEGLVRINRQGADLQIETQPYAPPDSRVELIDATLADWNGLQNALLKLRLD